MNNKKRRILSDSIISTEKSLAAIQGVLYDEKESYENYPESFKECESGIAMEDAIDALENAEEYLSMAIDEISSAIECGQ